MAVVTEALAEAAEGGWGGVGRRVRACICVFAIHIAVVVVVLLGTRTAGPGLTVIVDVLAREAGPIGLNQVIPEQLVSVVHELVFIVIVLYIVIVLIEIAEGLPDRVATVHYRDRSRQRHGRRSHTDDGQTGGRADTDIGHLVLAVGA